MINYEQKRAGNAYAAATDKEHYQFAGVEGGRTVAKKVPAQIVQNGFLGALAFAIETQHGYEAVFRAILDHLKSVQKTYGMSTATLEGFMKELCKKDADVLRAVTEEALAYLNYLRRFAKP